MKYKPRLLIVIIVLWLTIGLYIFGQNHSTYGKPLGVYNAPEGFTITSYSKNWSSSSKLNQIRNELLLNFHAEEIAYLKNIYIYPDSPDGVLAYTHYDIARDSQGKYVYKNTAYIEIFDADQYTNINQLAGVLAHEYGHHFTTYYLIKKENKFFNEWRNTGYAKVRGISNHPLITYQPHTNLSMHQWDIMEIAAEDYVQLFGSPNARKSKIYKDITQRIQQNIQTDFVFDLSFNMRPQENLQLPLAADVKGLEQYWLQLAGVVKGKIPSIPIKPLLRIVSKKEITKGYYQYRLEWDKIPGDILYEYTLVSYPDQQYAFPVPIKTVGSGQETYAIIGNALQTDSKTGKQQLVVDDYKGKHIFRLFIKESNQRIYSTELLKVDFNNISITPYSMYKDVHPSDWAYGAIKKLYHLNMMVGAPNGYFYPLKKVTYEEFIAVMNRYIYFNERERSSTFEQYIIDSKNITQAQLGAIKRKKNITREEVALLIYSYATSKHPVQQQTTKTPFTDDSNIKHKKEINYLYIQGIIKGSNGYFFPNNNISRQELACIIVELLR